MSIYICICMYIHTYVYIYVCLYVYTYILTYITNVRMCRNIYTYEGTHANLRSASTGFKGLGIAAAKKKK